MVIDSSCQMWRKVERGFTWMFLMRCVEFVIWMSSMTRTWRSWRH